MEFESSSAILRSVAFLVLLIAILGVGVGVYTGIYRRKKLRQKSNLEFITSQHNLFYQRTQFLIVVPDSAYVSLRLLDINEQEIKILFGADLNPGEHSVDFDPAGLEDGKYYLSLESNDTKIFRRIEIVTSKKSNEAGAV